MNATRPSFALVQILALVLGTLFAANVHAATDCTFTSDPSTQVMTLDADCTTDETLVVPDGWTLDGNGHVITAVDPPGAPFAGGVIENGGTVAGVVRLTIEGSFTFAGCQGGSDRLRGILFDGASGVIADNRIFEVHRPLSHFGCQEGNAIEVRNAPFDGSGENPVRVRIERNVADTYQKNGITANGNVHAEIRRNELQGAGMIDGIAQNGIQFGFGASGDMRRNLVDGNWFTGSRWAATGLLVFEASGIDVRHNEIRENEVGSSAETWGWFTAEASRNRYQNNDIFESRFGISITSRSCGFGLSSMDALAASNRAIANDIENTMLEGSAGIFIGADEDCFGGTGDTTATTTGTHAHGNRISGFAAGVVIDGAVDNHVSGNVYMP